MMKMASWFTRTSTGMAYNMNRYGLFTFILCIHLATNVQAQFKKPLEELSYFSKQYSESPAVYTQKRQDVTLEVVGDSLSIWVDVFEERIYLGSNPANFSRDQVFTSSFYKVQDLEAYTLVPGKKKYQKIPVAEFKENFDRESYIFYNDNAEISFNYPALVQGAKSVVKYRAKITDPHMLRMFFFQSYIPIHDASYTISYEAGISLSSQFFNDDNEIIEKAPLTTTDGLTIEKFSAKNVPKIKYEADAPSFSYLVPAVYMLIERYQTESGAQKKVLGSVDDLYSWYQTFIKDLQTETTQIDDIVAPLIEGAENELEKVRRIYYWVQANVKYIAFEDGMRGLIPHTADFVLEKRYGDCKDMSSLIVGMLQSAGIDANYTWIGSRKLPYKYSKTPAPIVDNHMIATFESDGKIYFLDATGQYTPINIPTSMIQGKECLIGKGDDFQLIEVPVIPKENNMALDSAFITLNDGSLAGIGKVTLTGYESAFNKYRLIKTDDEKVSKYLHSLLQKGNNKFLIDKFELRNIEDLEAPLDIEYEFNVSDYYKEIAGDIYINLMLDKSYLDDMIEDRLIPLENEYKFVNRNITVLNIPEGFEASFIPKDQSFQSDYFGYAISYKLQENKLIASKEIYLDYLLLEPEYFEEWNKMNSAYSDACRQVAVLSQQKKN